MKAYSGISTVSMPLVCGAGIAAMLAHPPSISSYLFPSLAMPVIAVMAALVRSKTANGSFTDIFRNRLPWICVFLAVGAISYSVSGIISLGSLSSRPLSSAADRLGCILNGIPFRDGENNALLKALLLGNRSGLSAATSADFRNAGAAHLLALSGMHLGIIYLIVGRALSIFGNAPLQRKLRSTATIALTGLYTIICGAGPSLMRAWLFILLNECTKILERPQPPQHIFCAALTIHIIARPCNIAEIGFQLSYLAMVGIVFIWPSIREWMDSRIWKAVSLSISCQMFTAPLTLLYFGTFPRFFMITNLVAAPLTPLVMCCGILAATANAAGIENEMLYAACELPASALRWLLGIISSM